MMSLNRAQLIGNVTRDPEVRNTATGQTVANFGVATNSQWTDQQGQKQERTEFHSIVAWGKLGEICGQYLVKGKRIFIEGRLQTREWDSPDGQKKQRTEIIADNMIMLDRAPSSNSGGAPSSYGSAPSNASEPAMEKSMGVEEIKVEEIPF
ncbi:MAG: single-stranded DNA-binding protein [Patescibacteria group bacterium]